MSKSNAARSTALKIISRAVVAHLDDAPLDRELLDRIVERARAMARGSAVRAAALAERPYLTATEREELDLARAYAYRVMVRVNVE